MQYSGKIDGNSDKEINVLKEPFEALVREMGMALIEFNVFRVKARKSSPPTVQVRVIVYKPGNMGTGDCSRVHYAILPRLEQEFPGHDFSVEVSTPGINRMAKDGIELNHYKGRGVRVWRTDTSCWLTGILDSVDEHGITIRIKEGLIRLDYEIVAKAGLDPSQEE